MDIDTAGEMWTLLLVGAIAAILAAVSVVIVITALVEILRSESLDNSSKALWILIVVVAPLLGAIIWFLWRRKLGP